MLCIISSTFAFLMNNFDLKGCLQSKTSIISSEDCAWPFNDLILYLFFVFELTDNF